jgi:16S rRNA (uracil1498-N3)-methyltransferase
MELFFAETLTENQSQYSIEGPEATHIAKVFRKKEGENILLTNGKGLAWTGQIETLKRNTITLNKIAAEQQPPLDYTLHLAVAPTKSNDRMEWLLEKATEIGVSSITPIICQQSERQHIKAERWNKILISAIKQSQRYHLPLLHPMESFSDFIGENPEAYLAHCDTGEKMALAELPLQQSYTICIGPEGDFSKSEIDFALAHGAQAITLGKARLRTETAGIVACHTIALKHEMQHL